MMNSDKFLSNIINNEKISQLQVIFDHEFHNSIQLNAFFMSRK